MKRVILFLFLAMLGATSLGKAFADEREYPCDEDLVPGYANTDELSDRRNEPGPDEPDEKRNYDETNARDTGEI